MLGWQANGVAPRTIGAGAAVLLCAADIAWAAGSGEFYPGDLGQAIVAIAVFIVLLLILRKWAWGPIITQLRHREDHIAESLQRAEELEKKAQQLFEDYSKRLDRTQGDAAEIISLAKREGGQLREEILAAARKDIQASAQQARQDIAVARDEVLKEMRQTTAEMAVNIAEQIMRKDIAPAEQRRLLGELMEDVRSSAAGES